MTPPAAAPPSTCRGTAFAAGLLFRSHGAEAGGCAAAGPGSTPHAAPHGACCRGFRTPPRGDSTVQPGCSHCWIARSNVPPGLCLKPKVSTPLCCPHLAEGGTALIYDWERNTLEAIFNVPPNWCARVPPRLCGQGGGHAFPLTRRSAAAQPHGPRCLPAMHQGRPPPQKPPPSPCCRQPQAAAHAVPQSARHSGMGEQEAFDPAIFLTPRPGGLVSRDQSMVSAVAPPPTSQPRLRRGRVVMEAMLTLSQQAGKGGRGKTEGQAKAPVREGGSWTGWLLSMQPRGCCPCGLGKHANKPGWVLGGHAGPHSASPCCPWLPAWHSMPLMPPRICLVNTVDCWLSPIHALYHLPPHRSFPRMAWAWAWPVSIR